MTWGLQVSRSNWWVAAAVLLSIFMDGCLSASGGGSGTVPFSDLSINPSVQIDWPNDAHGSAEQRGFGRVCSAKGKSGRNKHSH